MDNGSYQGYPGSVPSGYWPCVGVLARNGQALPALLGLLVRVKGVPVLPAP